MYEYKKNIFDHIIYEFNMYLYTYTLLLKGEKDKRKRSMILESQAIHLRNLIEFFNSEPKCITVDTIFSHCNDYSFDDDINAKQTINKTIEHLTIERVKWFGTEKDLTYQFAYVIKTMFKKYIPCRIEKCVQQLIREEDVKDKHLEELKDPIIQKRLKVLSEWFKCNPLGEQND